MAKKRQYYFPHDLNARSDEKLLRVRKRHGVAGYGVYFMLIEMLAQSSDYMLTASAEDLAFEMHVADAALVDSVIRDFDLFGFTEDGSRFYSDSLLRRLADIDDVRGKRSTAGKRSAEARWQQKITNSNDAVTNVEHVLPKVVTSVTDLLPDDVTNGQHEETGVEHVLPKVVTSVTDLLPDDVTNGQHEETGVEHVLPKVVTSVTDLLPDDVTNGQHEETGVEHVLPKVVTNKIKENKIKSRSSEREKGASAPALAGDCGDPKKNNAGDVPVPDYVTSGRLPIETLFVEIKKDLESQTMFAETTMRVLSSAREQCVDLLCRFMDEQRMIDEKKATTRQDFVSHFRSWAKIQLEKAKKPNGGKQGRPGTSNVNDIWKEEQQ